MWPNPFYPTPPNSDLGAQIRAQIESLKGLEKFAEEYVKDKKDKKEKENPKLKLPEIKMNVFEFAFLVFALSPISWLLLGGLWAKILGLH